MQNTSLIYKDLIKKSGRVFKAKIITTLADNSSIEITDKEIMLNSLSIKTGTTDNGAFSIGNAVIGQLDFEIDNSEGAFDNISFEDAVFDVRIGLIVEQKYDKTYTVEWIRKGIFTAEEITVSEKTISILAYDNIAKLDRLFNATGISFPCTLFTLYQNLCSSCGVVYDSSTFPNSNLSVTSHEITDDASCRDVLSYIAQLACRFVYADVYGTVKLGWYRNTGYTVSEPQRINGTVTITGVQATDINDNVYLIGTNDYCIHIDDNPLLCGRTALNNSVWWSDLMGKQLTPFTADIISDPSIECGDIVTVSDRFGNTYLTPITNMVYQLDSMTAIACDAETLKEKQRTVCSPSAHIIVAANQKINKKISEYDIRAKQFSQMAANAMGFYQTDEPQQDGSVITYLHDKPLLADSVTIWKKTVNGFFVSTDGGQTYTAGIDSSGNAVLNLLAVKGIVADWIKAGTLTALNGVTSINLDNGRITISLSDNNKLIIWTNGLTVKDDNNNTIAAVYAGRDSGGNVSRGYVDCDHLRLLDSNNNVVGDFFINNSDKSSLNVDNLYVNGSGVTVNNTFYTPQTITVDGVNYSVLARRTT